MKNAMQKDFWREIQHTRSRFFSIMILVALSVAFLSGLKATAPDMKKTGDDYLDSLHLADIQVLSTLGLTDDDITAIRAQDKVEDAEGEYVIDAFASSDSLDAVVKVLSLTGRGINEVLLRGGRMPERADECVVEENMLSLMNIEIGDRITLTPGERSLRRARAGHVYGRRHGALARVPCGGARHVDTRQRHGQGVSVPAARGVHARLLHGGLCARLRRGGDDRVLQRL